jgi:hypothetical protein
VIFDAPPEELDDAAVASAEAAMLSSVQMDSLEAMAAENPGAAAAVATAAAQ